MAWVFCEGRGGLGVPGGAKWFEVFWEEQSGLRCCGRCGLVWSVFGGGGLCVLGLAG